ncbi:hypothetical protein N7541_001169 [Penicillium brevicompactum]|uniref:Uncharacterized protein n=1 Tax=Penicillium brevicompactum TaxID=5074 RepID=A0A9W9S0E1_PENBR|nr:hypothetical protein N7541_001169 [Penicillium brevicompactum]
MDRLSIQPIQSLVPIGWVQDWRVDRNQTSPKSFQIPISPNQNTTGNKAVPEDAVSLRRHDFGTLGLLRFVLVPACDPSR